MLSDGTIAEDFPEDLFDWMSDSACEHHYMREIETIFHPYLEYPSVWLREGRSLEHPEVVSELDSGHYPALVAVLDKFPHAHGVVVTPADAPGVLDDLDRLESVTMPTPTRVLLDESGVRLWPILDPSGFTGSREFTSVHNNPKPDVHRTDLLELGIVGTDIVVRSAVTLRALLRCPVVEQHVGGDEIQVGYRILRRITFRNPVDGAEVSGYGHGVAHMDFGNLHEPDYRMPRTLRVVVKQRRLADGVYFPAPLRAALKCCIANDNPIVTYYSGHSLGFERAAEVGLAE